MKQRGAVLLARFGWFELWECWNVTEGRWLEMREKFSPALLGVFSLEESVRLRTELNRWIVRQYKQSEGLSG